MTVCLPLVKNVLTPLAESVLIPLRLLTAMSATATVIQKKFMNQELQQ